MTRKREPVVANPLIILTSAASGLQVAVAGMWVKTVEELHQGTVITLTDSVTVVVRERFPDVMEMFAMHNVSRAKGVPLE